MKKPPNKSDYHTKHTDNMKTALSLAKRGLGNVWPNPAVGCIIVKDGQIVGRGWTQPGGRPHAEIMAVEQAGNGASGGTVYLNLEPCNHQGLSPPCTEALIAAGIKEVYASLSDPDPRVSGGGFERLMQEKIAVYIGLLSELAREINKGFFLRIEHGRPLITFKTATTIDGKIATKDGISKWITGKEARALGHQFRSMHDAVMVGSGTAIADNPQLTSRLSGVANKDRPRIVVDGRLRLSLSSKMVMSARETPVWLITRDDHPPEKLQPYKDHNVDLILIPPEDSGGYGINSVLQHLGNRGLTRVLVEGGGQLASSLFSADLIDQIAWFRAPSVMGNDGLPAVGNLELCRLSEMPRFVRCSWSPLGSDHLEILMRSR